ncbi:MAG: hypothetical protein H0Z37_03325 [Firmicutes bacterium]|nr:hypothetical protein [Bacillota bacterium]
MVEAALLVVERCRATLYDPEKGWTVDYVRLRFSDQTGTGDARIAKLTVRRAALRERERGANV